MSPAGPAPPGPQSRSLLDAPFGARPRSGVGAIARGRADPRSKFLLLLVCNVLVRGVAPTGAVGLIAVLVGMLIALDEPVRVLMSYCAITAMFWGLTQLPQWWPSGLAVFLGVVAYWLLRFAISLSLGAWFVTTTRVSTLLAALNQLRAPRFLTIPLAVLFRFVPVALDEARGVIEAMRLRGYSGSYLWRHPLQCIEKLVVPVLAASALYAAIGLPLGVLPGELLDVPLVLITGQALGIPVFLHFGRGRGLHVWVIAIHVWVIAIGGLAGLGALVLSFRPIRDLALRTTTGHCLLLALGACALVGLWALSRRLYLGQDQ